MTNRSCLEVLQSNECRDDDTCITFVLNEEDHTLGNSLRYMVMKNPKVKFCGYAVPHPSENKINFRVQTYSTDSSATEQFKKGLTDLYKMCEHILDTFQASVEHFQTVQATVKEESMETR